jgi:hypothetical protein
MSFDYVYLLDVLKIYDSEVNWEALVNHIHPKSYIFLVSYTCTHALPDV